MSNVKQQQNVFGISFTLIRQRTEFLAQVRDHWDAVEVKTSAGQFDVSRYTYRK